MTTIVIDGATQSVYTDSRATKTDSQGVETYSKATKIVLLKDGSLVVVTGSVSLYDKIARECAGNDMGLSLPTYTKGESNSTVFHVVWREEGLVVNKYVPNNKYIGDFIDRLWAGLLGACVKCGGYSKETYTLGSTNYSTAGSGGDYAFAALKCGKTPEEAIKIASLCDRFTDGDIKRYEVLNLLDN